VHLPSHVPVQVPLQSAVQSKLAFPVHFALQVPLHETSHEGGVALHVPWHFAYRAAVQLIGVQFASHATPVSTLHWALASTLMLPQSAMLAACAGRTTATNERAAKKPMNKCRAIASLLTQKAEPGADSPRDRVPRDLAAKRFE
jgi:hypothetical protein